MFTEKRNKSNYIEYGYWSKWDTMFLGLELRYQKDKPKKQFWSVTFSITIFYRELVFVEYTKWLDGKDHSSKPCLYESEF